MKRCAASYGARCAASYGAILCVNSIEQLVKYNPGVGELQVAHIDYRSCVEMMITAGVEVERLLLRGAEAQCRKDMFDDALEAAEFGCSAICISVHPMLNFAGEQNPWELGEKTFECYMEGHVVMLYDPDVLRLVASESLDSEDCMPALCATLEVKGAVSSAVQPALYRRRLFLVSCCLRDGLPFQVKTRAIEAYFHRCAQFAREQGKSTKISIAIGGIDGALPREYIDQLAVVDELNNLCASSIDTIAYKPRRIGARTLINTFTGRVHCYWCGDCVYFPYFDWIGVPLCDLCQDWHLGHGPFREEADRIRARGAEWDGGPYSPTAADRCAVLLSRWFRARMLPDDPVCGLIAAFLVLWYEP